ncbi:MAG TPA: ATP-binding protein [Micromonosporaceae bacterium]
MSERGQVTEFSLPGGPESIGVARERARDFLLGADPTLSAATVRDAVLAISEMVTNAVRHAPGACTLAIGLDGQRIDIRVTDTSRTVPRLRTARFDGSGGFGLHMLEALAGAVETVLHAGGKTVSVCLDRAGRPSDRTSA